MKFSPLVLACITDALQHERSGSPHLSPGESFPELPLLSLRMRRDRPKEGPHRLYEAG